ncbi:MAG: DoxX family protein [Candidatus Dormibacteria bacterium]
MTAVGGAFLLAGRILFAGLFVFSARGHIQRHPQYVRIATGKLPIAFLAGVPTGIYLLLASVSIAAGIWPDIGSLMIAAFVLPAALFFHPFWTIQDPAARRTQEGGFYRNVTLLGAALALFALFAAAGQVPFAVTGPAIHLS